MTVDTLGRKMWKTHGETFGHDLQMMDENRIYVSLGEGTTWFGFWTFMMSSFVLFFHNPPKKQFLEPNPQSTSHLATPIALQHTIPNWKFAIGFRPLATGQSVRPTATASAALAAFLVPHGD